MQQGGASGGVPGKMMGGMPGMMSGGGMSKDNIARVWTVDENGKIRMMRLKTGITDGKSTEIVMSRDNPGEGMKLITGISTESGTNNDGKQRTGSATGPQAPWTLGCDDEYGY